MAKVTCIDVLTFQTGINYNKVKTAGITAVIICAGYGREIATIAINDIADGDEVKY